MATYCSICGKKINPFIQDFILSRELYEFKVCASCEENRNNLIKYAKNVNIEPYQGLVAELKKSIEIQTNQVISQYLNNLLEEAESMFKMELEKRNEEKQKEIDRQNEIKEYNEKINNFMLTTANEFSGYDIVEYKGVIASEVVLGTGFFSEFGAGLADFFGMESEEFSSKLEHIRSACLERLIVKAMEKEADAIIALDFDYNMFSSNIIGLIINGTAVKVKKKKETTYVEPINAIEKLASLRVNNYINEEEFLAKKKILLDKIV